MEPFLSKSTADRRLYINEAAARTGKSPVVIEKDYWVCWLLGELFSWPDLRDHLTFKGGTSLSKVYGVIERFSEDIDLAIHRDHLGFAGADDPEAGTSNNDTRRRLDALADACQRTVQETILPTLRQRVMAAGLGNEESVTIAEDDGSTLLFHYPRNTAGDGYIQPHVKMEFGARSDDWPLERASVTSYMEEALATALGVQQREVTVLTAQRTFWEKATILHAEYHRPPDSSIRNRLSRHYYDLYCLATHPVGDLALLEVELLARVATHKSVFFRSGWAMYDRARPGSLHLCPPAHRLSSLQRDYGAMRDMFFTAPPAFATVMETLAALETRINAE